MDGKERLNYSYLDCYEGINISLSQVNQSMWYLRNVISTHMLC